MKHPSRFEDFDAKRVARIHLYRQARDVFNATFWPKGWAVTLCGDEPAEVGPMRHLLRWDPNQVLFVDELLAGPSQVQSRWPQAKSFYGDLRDVLPDLQNEGIGFINLDFMGFMNEDTEECIEEVGPLLNPGAFVSFTFARARENQYSRLHLEYVHEFLHAYIRKENSGLKKYLTEDMHQRVVGYALALIDLLDRPYLNPAGMMLYRKKNHGLSMGSVYLHMIGAHQRTEAWRNIVANEESWQHILRSHRPEELYLEDLKKDLRRTHSSKEVREILHL